MSICTFPPISKSMSRDGIRNSSRTKIGKNKHLNVAIAFVKACLKGGLIDDIHKNLATINNRHSQRMQRREIFCQFNSDVMKLWTFIPVHVQCNMMKENGDHISVQLILSTLRVLKRFS